MESRYLEAGEIIGRRHFISPFDMYGSLMGMSANMQGRKGANVFFIGGHGRVPGARRSVTFIGARVGGGPRRDGMVKGKKIRRQWIWRRKHSDREGRAL